MCQWVQPQCSQELCVEDWEVRLEDVRLGRLDFEAVRIELEGEVCTALDALSRQTLALALQASSTCQAFSEVLGDLSTTGKALQQASGDLQHSRDSVFKSHIPVRGSRQLAEELSMCRENVLRKAQENGEVLTTTASRLLRPHHKVCAATKSAGEALKHASELLSLEGQLLRMGMERSWLRGSRAEEIVFRYQGALADLTEDGKRLRVASSNLSESRRAYRRGIVSNRSVIRNAEASLRNDQRAVFGWAWEHVSEVRRLDREFVLTVVNSNGERLEGAPLEFRRDREVVLTAIHQSSGWALQFADDSLRRDREVVLAAVRRSGWALEHAAEEMRGDREVVLAAVQADGEALEFASEELRADREVALAAVRRGGACALNAVAVVLREDKEVAEATVRENGLALEMFSEAMRNDLSVVLVAVRANGMALQHATERLRGERRVVAAAVHANPSALQFASPELRKEPQVVKVAVEKDGQALRFAAEEVRQDRSVVAVAVQHGGLEALQHASNTLRGDRGLLLAAKEYELNAEESWHPGTNTALPPEPVVIQT